MAQHLGKNKEEVDEWKFKWQQLAADVDAKRNALEDVLRGGGGKSVCALPLPANDCILLWHSFP